MIDPPLLPSATPFLSVTLRTWPAASGPDGSGRMDEDHPDYIRAVTNATLAYLFVVALALGYLWRYVEEPS